MRKFKLDNLSYSEVEMKWCFHKGGESHNAFIYFQNKKEAEKFQRYATKFIFNMYVQSNDLYIDFFVMYRRYYFQFPYGCDDQKALMNIIEGVDFQFDRWSRWSVASKEYSYYIFSGPKKIQAFIYRGLEILRRFAKTKSDTSMIYLIDSKLTYLKFLQSQLDEFDFLYDKGESSKIIQLPIMKIATA